MSQFPGLASNGLCIHPRMTPSGCPVTPGFPIRKSPDYSSFDSSPGLIAAYHVLHRLSTPRHPPCTLSSLTTFMRGCPPTGHGLRPPPLENSIDGSSSVSSAEIHRGCAVECHHTVSTLPRTAWNRFIVVTNHIPLGPAGTTPPCSVQQRARRPPAGLRPHLQLSKNRDSHASETALPRGEPRRLAEPSRPSSPSNPFYQTAPTGLRSRPTAPNSAILGRFPLSFA